MLSCRFSGPGTTPYCRRLRSADQILRITSEQGADTLPPLPLIPYAVSLSTTMIYRALRDGQRQIECVRHNLMQCCNVLSSLSPVWTCVRGIEKLARRLLKLLSTSQAAVLRDTTLQTFEGFDGNNIAPVVNTQSDGSYTHHDATAAQTGTTCQCSGQCHCVPLEMIPKTWHQELGGPCVPFDTAFHEMFDGGVPNVFRGHGTWEMLNYFDTSSPPLPNHQRVFMGEQPTFQNHGD